MKENSGTNPKPLSKEFSRADLKRSFTNLFDKNEESEARSNSGTFSDIEEIQIDFGKLNSVKIYQEHNVRYVANQLTESEIVVEEIIRKIKKESTFLLIESHIKSKLPAHSSVLCLEMVDLLIHMAENSNCITEKEKMKALEYTEDEEPVKNLLIFKNFIKDLFRNQRGVIVGSGESW